MSTKTKADLEKEVEELRAQLADKPPDPEAPLFDYSLDVIKVPAHGQILTYKYAGDCIDCGTRLFTSAGELEADELLQEHVYVEGLCPTCYPDNILEVNTAIKDEYAVYVRVGQCQYHINPGVLCPTQVYRCISHPIRNDDALGDRFGALVVASVGEKPLTYCKRHDPTIEQRKKAGNVPPADEWVNERYQR